MKEKERKEAAVVIHAETVLIIVQVRLSRCYPANKAKVERMSDKLRSQIGILWESTYCIKMQAANFKKNIAYDDEQSHENPMVLAQYEEDGV